MPLKKQARAAVRNIRKAQAARREKAESQEPIYGPEEYLPI